MQLPRLYNVYMEMGILTSFESILSNVFIPLFEVTIDPASHPQLHVFLKHVRLKNFLACLMRCNSPFICLSKGLSAVFLL